MNINDLTRTGKLLTVAAVLGALGLGLPILAWASTVVPKTSTVPKIVFMLPIIVIGVVIFYGGGFVLNAMGKPVVRERFADDESEPQE